MQRISRREFVKRSAVTGAAFTSIPAILAACGTSPSTSNKPSKLVVAAVQGNEDGPLKKVVGNYKSQTGIEVQVVEFPYDSLFSKLVTTFQANDSSYDLCMMDDPWMPKFGTDGASCISRPMPWPTKSRRSPCFDGVAWRTPKLGPARTSATAVAARTARSSACLKFISLPFRFPPAPSSSGLIAAGRS